MNRKIILALLALFFGNGLCKAGSSDSADQVSVQGVLNVGKLFIHGSPRDPGEVIDVYFLQLPISLGRQLAAQKIKGADRFGPNLNGVVMVDVGWPDNDREYNPFDLKRKVGRKIKVFGSLDDDFRAPQTHLSRFFLNPQKVEVLKSFDSNGW
jgi:hypothetical protein